MATAMETDPVALMDLVKYAKIQPANLQIELHPYLQQTALVNYAKSLGMKVTGFSPLGSSSCNETALKPTTRCACAGRPTFHTSR